MIISPPFLLAHDNNQLDADYVTICMPQSPLICPNTSVPEGSYPISLNMGWHGGRHFHTPDDEGNALPVLAIADGEIVFARKPTAINSSATHPLNYNPYGNDPKWTDDGFVLIKHTTDIGSGSNAQGLVYYSLISHLSQLKGNAAKVAAGTADTAAKRKIYRKDEIGIAGQIYGAPGHIHMEIICDDDNLQKILGRQNIYDALDTNTHGRSDAVYGEIYFRLPIGTKIYQVQPANNTPQATAGNPVLKTLDKVMIVGLRYAAGDATSAAHRGDAVLTTYEEDGTVIGTLKEPEAEYKLYKTATQITKAYQDAHAPVIPAPSAVYELLRFGRIINTEHETLTPADTPHWRKIRYETGDAGHTGWINLNTERITIYSDADFPPWKGWRLIHDDLDTDSRCNSAQIVALIEDASNADGKLMKQELIGRMGLRPVRDALRKTICCFPSEWVKETIEERWGWLKTDPEYKLEGKDWDDFKKHAEALTVSSSSLPEAFRDALWRLEPREFIKQFRMCGWLSEAEMLTCMPLVYQTNKGNKNTIVIQANLKTQIAKTRLLNRNHSVFMSVVNKYGIVSRNRLAHFLSQIYQETGVLKWSEELASGAEYEGRDDLGNTSQGDGIRYKGRGLIQITGRSNYEAYSYYRGKKGHESYAVEPNNKLIAINPYESADAAGLYWVRRAVHSNDININRIADVGTGENQLRLVTKNVNGQSDGLWTGLVARRSHLKTLVYVLTDTTSILNPEKIRRDS